MWKVSALVGLICLNVCLLASTNVSASEMGLYSQGGVLQNVPDYSWWYGCSPTTAGMMMGYYDIHGYEGLSYDNLVPGGTAEYTTFPANLSWDALAENVIASKEHVHDFYGSGFAGIGDDLQQVHNFNSLADFMGTSQDASGNPNGYTTFYYWTNGDRFTAQDAFDYDVWNQDGMYGVLEYLKHAGYDAQDIYTQMVYDPELKSGFSFFDYMAEIDAGRVVMIQLMGHSLFGYGYGDNDLVYFNDTWSAGPHTMTWGGSYGGMEQWGVLCFEPAGGSAATVPEPSSLVLLGTGLVVLVPLRRRLCSGCPSGKSG